jgi:uncharacterized membrane protein YhaH (DUF805 family)
VQPHPVAPAGSASSPFDGPLPGATPGRALQRFFRRYVVFSGRASRSEYWWVVAVHVVAFLGASVLLLLTTDVGQADPAGPTSGAVAAFTVVFVLYLLATAVPSLALIARRLHDANLSAWWLAVTFVPGLGPIVLVVLMLLPSHPAGWRYDRDWLDNLPPEDEWPMFL